MKVIRSEAITSFMQALTEVHQDLYEQLTVAEESKNEAEWNRVQSVLTEMDNILDSLTALEETGTGREFANDLVSSFVDSGLALATEALEKGCDVIVIKLDEDDTDEVAYYFIGHEHEVLANLKDKFAKFLQ